MTPKILHFIWIDRGGIPMPEEYGPNIQAWRDQNPGWEVKFWDYLALDEFISETYPQYLELWRKLSKAVMRSDLARLLLLHHFGGFYLDVDLKPFTGLESPLERFLDSGVIYNKYAKGGFLPEFPSMDTENLKQRETIFSRENCQIDSSGHGIANNMLHAHGGNRWILDFVEQQKECYMGLVLDFLGPWALTRFWRTRLSEKKESALSEMVIIPSSYFLWEQWRMHCEPPSYSISAHTGENTWGDKTKEQWWKV
jgi:hypothetical protein